MEGKVKADGLPRGIFVKRGIYWIRYTDAQGRERREPGGGTQQQAEQKLLMRKVAKAENRIVELRTDKEAAARAAVLAEQQAEASIVHFENWIDEAEKYHKLHSSESHSYDFARKCIYLRKALGKRDSALVNRAAVLDWMGEAAAGEVTGPEEWGAANWNRYHSCFSSIFELAIERAIGDGLEPPLNPMRYIPRRTEKWKERYWSTAEDQAIIKATKKAFPGYEDIFILAEEVGYRKSEQLRAKVGDYNPDTHKITVHQRKSKNAEPVRYVPLSDRGIAAYYRLAGDRKAGEPLQLNKYKYKGEAMTDFRYWFDDVLVSAGIADDLASWHVSRHTFCSRAVANGVPITDVKEYAGYSDLRTTSRYLMALKA